MSLFISSLNSGSNGNCYYIGNEQEAVLIDAGISCRETEKRMKRLELKMDKVKAIFISHEHGDHIRGVEGIASKHRVPVYITAATLHHSRLRVNEQLINTFKAFETISIGSISVKAFSKLHDASDPHSFMVSGNGVNIGVFTDIGSPCEQVISHFKKCNAAFLETNYDEVMLEQGTYPVSLKKRIRSDYGHLSNIQALELFTAHKPDFMSHLLLSHLSKDNNDPDLVRALFSQVAGTTEISVASRYNETPVYHIQGNNTKQPTEKIKAMHKVPKQIQLF